MKRLLSVLVFFHSLLWANPAVDLIHDDYRESQTGTFHTRGLLTYGSHTNTFHVRQIHARYNVQMGETQFFLALRGQQDTHDPPINYQYILDNISLYDYGVTARFAQDFFVSLRGAATYRENYHTHLLILPYYHVTNAAEFDAPSQYHTVYPTGPGVRLGYESSWLLFGYSQGDFRHSIPSGFIARLKGEDWYTRAVLLSEHEDPANWRPDLKRYKGQLSYGQSFKKLEPWVLSGLVEVTYHQSGVWWVRLEQAVERWGFTLALRELFKSRERGLLEVALTYQLHGLARLGVQVSSNQRVYLGAEVNF